MAMTPEAKVKKVIKDWLKERDIYFFSPIGGAYSEGGVPDIVICYRGRFVGCEVKAPIKIGKRGKPLKQRGTTALQDDHLKRIGESEGHAMVVRSLDEFVKSITDLHNLIDLLECP